MMNGGSDDHRVRMSPGKDGTHMKDCVRRARGSKLVVTQYQSQMEKDPYLNQTWKKEQSIIGKKKQVKEKIPKQESKIGSGTQLRCPVWKLCGLRKRMRRKGDSFVYSEDTHQSADQISRSL